MAKIKVTKSDPPVTVKEVIRTKTGADDTADIRDDISFLVGRGGAPNLADDDSRGTYARLAQRMGTDKARKLLEAMSIHAQRPEVMAMKSPEQRIQSFYNIGSSNPDISPYIQQAKVFGSGVLSGFSRSSLLGNQILSGTDEKVAATNNPVATDLAKKILLRVKK